MMWDKEQIDLDQGIIKFRITENNTPISFEQWSHLISNSTNFVEFYIGILKSSEFQSFFWEVKPTNSSLWKTEFEFVLVNSLRLSDIQADSSAFKEHFNGSSGAVSFPNLRADAQLVVPTKINEDDSYGHLAEFMRNAPKEQVIEFWKVVGLEYQKRVG